ncbi:MAG: Kazal-type serine protease inhibitor family protein, partial [Myxococcota bacterium]
GGIMAHSARFALTALLLSTLASACAVGIDDPGAPILRVEDRAPPASVAPGAGADSSDTAAERAGAPVYFGHQNELAPPADVESPSYIFELVADAHMTIQLERRSADGPRTIGFTLYRVAGEALEELDSVYGYEGTAAMSLYTVHGGTYAVQLLDGVNPEALVLTLSCISGTCAPHRQPGESCGSAEGAQCDEGLVCLQEVGACNQTEALGSCHVAPVDCPKAYEPVCGCDGETWGNECFARKSGMSVSYLGACK